ncbi:Carboxyl-terminal-processing peptidase 1, chloroplastic [Gracilariopsis chorda]|uniref:Carboxyl-terminal-processing peptidase 1, chloroplastic n=1 Tax=Gracilariopsis chorda TaxID=448386 RepID=A0A2V3J0G2_9FLOR|nr:Carboxyl-terminal-processing peptidase 1, chloroplastic [Gracilariopsis chorda]|eukprot:PXF47815.1 Carboxyl-terminal-processing peptidase 1, chloroplastic [Gracilariopsis chorda]
MYPREPAFITPTASLSPHALRKVAASTALAAALFTLPALPSRAIPVLDNTRDTEHELVEQAWKIVNDYYLDPSFNHLDWQSQLETLLNSPFPDRSSTYKALRRAVAKLEDRYTRVLDPRQMEVLRKFDVSGVGLLLSNDASGRLVVATEPAKNTAAAKAGVKRGDQVLAVDGRDVTDVPAFEVAEWMQGQDGTTMQVRFRDLGDASLTRRYQPESSPAAVTRVAVVDHPDGRMGYIRLAEFRASGRAEVAKALQQLQKDGAEWIVVDLRGNHGGVFEGALEIAGLFEGDGRVVARVSGRNAIAGGLQEAYKSRVVRGDKQLDNSIDLAILIDNESASSSEVLAGGLRDSCRAALVGERSFGKGVIQGVFGLQDGGGIVVTVAEYRTPRGDRIDGVGLPPDIPAKHNGLDQLLRFLGISRVDENGIQLSREQVREVTRYCRTENQV